MIQPQPDAFTKIDGDVFASFHMALFTTRRRFLALLTAALFVILFLTLYHSPTPPPPPPAPLTPVAQPKQASGPPPPPAPAILATPPSPPLPRVLPQALILHNAPGTWPRLTRLADTSILLSFTRVVADPPTRILTVQRSVDNGATFAPWGVVTRCKGDCGNLVLLEVPASSSAKSDEPQQPRILAAFRNHDVADPVADRHRITWFRITICESVDGGRSWRYVTQAAQKGAPLGVWEPFLRLGAGGEVQMTYSRELQPRDQDSIMRVSYDQGRTWSDPRTITGGEDKTLRDGMTGVVATVDGGRPALVMVFETTRRGRTFTLEAVLSYDDGETWGHRQVVFDGVLEGRNAGAPQIEAFANGGLAVVFMTDMDVEPRKWPWKASVKVIFGGPLRDGKIEWHAPQDAFSDVSLWPGIFKLSDTQLMAVCEHGNAIQGRILEWDT